MTTKKTKPVIQASDELAAIDEQLNAAMEHLDVTNTKVTEILSTVDVTPSAAAALFADADSEPPTTTAETPPKPADNPPKKSPAKE